MKLKLKRVFFEKEALNYPLGTELLQRFRLEGLTVSFIGSHNRVTGIPGGSPQEAYLEAKRTLVVGVKKVLEFETCKPSAHYQLPLCTSCIGQCQYCYLNTTLGKKPYLRVYVNLDEILQRARTYIEARQPEVTYFEGAATSDPLPYEDYTQALARTILFFGREPLGRFRFVTKFSEVDSLLKLAHQGHTHVRFSLNTPAVICQYEHQTPGVEERIAAAHKVAKADYPLGFLIAPVICYPHWQADYEKLLENLAYSLAAQTLRSLTFEVITHRFTTRAKSNINLVFPGNTLPMDEGARRYKYGQFGYGKYIYPQAEMDEVKTFFSQQISEKFPQATLEYIV